MKSELGALAVFAAVVEAKNFRAAAERLGVTRSAVSQSIRRLEESLGAALLVRTTRSVNLTEAGERLFATVAPALAEMRTALDIAQQASAEPRGRLRIATSSIAEEFISGGLLAEFCRRNPNVQLDIFVTDEEIDIVENGFDAGVRLGEVLEQDMIAIPIVGSERQLAVCSPSYLDGREAPDHPRDLVFHRCIGWRPGPGTAPYRWEFTENDRDFTVDVKPEITTNDMRLMTQLALAGAGITFGMETTFRPAMERGELVPLLESYLPSFPGFFLYYPSRRNMAPKLRALVDHVRSARR